MPREDEDMDKDDLENHLKLYHRVTWIDWLFITLFILLPLLFTYPWWANKIAIAFSESWVIWLKAFGG